ncbi:hypothetical protein ACFWF7_10070 [Nocardia sp. NPDC060256]|uniref:hypothetical protein n=1 Tax=unclassified Nocardia TaxID=2637762 RepID=UPI00365CE71B
MVRATPDPWLDRGDRAKDQGGLVDHRQVSGTRHHNDSAVISISGENMTISAFPATMNVRLGDRISLLDIIAAYGPDAVVARIAALRANGCRSAARAMERELNTIDFRSRSLD